jgi:two-component system, OmpR family, sensor histidine kinase ArlS
MPVRLRITFLFTGLAMLILLVVCGSIYYFSYEVRKSNIERRLKNRAITTARLLAQKETFDSRLVQKIDSLTTIALKDKVVQAYSYENEKIYSYSDVAGDSLQISKDILDDARINGMKFFLLGDKEVVAYHYSDDRARIVVISAAEDVDGKNSLLSLRNILLLSFFFGSVFVLLTGFFFSTRLLQPVKKITADVEEISAQNLARRIKKGTSNDEWNKLADTLNRLLNRLQESFEFQKRFISNASHELSTPLTSISSQLEVTLQKERSPEDYRQVMESLYQDVKHMSKLTQTLLEFAKASGTAEGLEMNVIRVDEIILGLPSEISRINKDYRVSIEFGDLPGDEEQLLVFGNEVLLLMAIRNVVLNGCKYSDDHHTSVMLKTKDEQLLIIIKDKGRGIPAGEMENIFQPFYRVKQHSNTAGFGLGLSLALRIIAMHKGDIDVSSEPGKGSIFSISLPIAAPKSIT